MKMTDDNDKADTEEPNYSPYMNDIVVQENQQNRATVKSSLRYVDVGER